MLGGSATCPTCRVDFSTMVHLTCVEEFLRRVNDMDEKFKKVSL